MQCRSAIKSVRGSFLPQTLTLTPAPELLIFVSLSLCPCVPLFLCPPPTHTHTLPAPLPPFAAAFCNNMYEFKKGACAEPVQVATVASNVTAVNATFMTAHNVIDIADGGIPVLMGSVGLSVAS